MVFNFRTPSFFDDSPVAQDTQVLTEFLFKELKAATQNFSQDNFLGSGGSGKVFKGRLQDGSLVAIKRLHKEETSKEFVFQNELEVRSLKVQHRNILSLRGYCRNKKERLLVYPLMINNSLKSHLGPNRGSGVQPLSWAARMQIASGVARGLAYLHHFCDPKIIHLDICPSNILLDQEFEALIGDFGSARIMHQKDLVHGTIECVVLCDSDTEDDFNDGDTEGDVNNQSTLSSEPRCKHFLYIDTYVTTAVCGRLGFLAPEYCLAEKCTLKNDVFGFGVMLLNLVTGKGPCFKDQPKEEGRTKLRDWTTGVMPDKLEQWMDPDLQGNYIYEEAKKLVMLALQCAHTDPKQRPEMLEVVRVFEDSAETLQFPLSSSRPLVTLGRSESESTPFYSFNSLCCN